MTASSARVWGCAIAIATAAGCTKTNVGTQEVNRLPSSQSLEVKLVDGTTFVFDGARATDGNLCGTPSGCSGPSCSSVLADHCVASAEVASMKISRVEAGTAAVVAGGTFVALVAGAAVIFAASRSSGPSPSAPSPSVGAVGSCPRVYSWNGETWQLDSGTYGASYFEAAPRTDFDRLDFLVSDRGTYRMRLVNEQDETEHTDLVRLRVVDHPTGTRVVPSAAGQMHTFRNESSPLTAQDFRGKDARDLVLRADGREWSSDLVGRSVLKAEDGRDGLRLVFAKPPGVRVAKLAIAAHNTEWAGQMLGYMLAQLGPTLPGWFAKMNADPAARAELTAFLVREGMLSVRVKTTAGWSERGIFWAAGREIAKEEAFEIALDDVAGDTLEIELESALDFWGIDAVSLAYGKDEALTVRTLSPSSARVLASATLDRGRDVAHELAAVDGTQFETVEGDVAELTFDAAPETKPRGGRVRSFVLETTGYYVPHVTPAVNADPAAIAQLLATPFSASRLALAFRVASPR